MKNDVIQISSNVYWVGVLDPDLRVFDIIMKTEFGTTYNSYLIKGSEGVAIIETVKEKFKDEFLEKIESLVDFNDIKYIVLNHTEPDHSGALYALLEKAQRAQVVISKVAQNYLKHILNKDISPIKADDNLELSLGSKRLKFIYAPFLHWPDTMFTYLVEDKILFPCDFLGCHFSDKRMFNDLASDFSFAFKYYFDHIMRPFKEYALSALEKIYLLDISIIAPSHGPILRTNIGSYLSDYQAFSYKLKSSSEKKAMIVYGSAYGNTEKLAKNIQKGLEEEGILVSVFDIQSIIGESIIDLVEETDALLIGSPTINGDSVKMIWDFLASFATIKTKGKIGASFGSFGWSGEAPRLISQRLKDMKFEVEEEPFRVTFIPTDDDLLKAQEYGKRIANKIKEAKT